jgi:5-methylcytosine-specific restriction enzyme A
MAEKVRASAYARGYGRRWQKASTAFLLAHPLCVDPFKDHGNAPRAAEVTDHIVPHKGDMHLFWNPKNWQPLCKECHDKKTAKEDGGFGNQRRVVVEGGLEVGSAPRLSDGIPGVGSNL